MAGIFKIIIPVQTVSVSVFSLSDDVFSKATCNRKYGLCWETLAKHNTRNGSASTSDCCHILCPLRVSDFFQTVIASWKGNRVSGYYFPILQAEKLKQEERRKKNKNKNAKKKNKGRFQNSWLDSASPILAPLLPPLRRAVGAVCLCSGGLLGAFR